MKLIWMGPLVVWLTCVIVGSAIADGISPPPPEHPQVDTQGVDVQTQQMHYSHKDVGIGPADHHGLAFTVNLILGSGGSGHDPFFGIGSATYSSGSDIETDYVGNLGDTSEGGISLNGDGSAGSATWYHLKDGTQFIYGQLISKVTNPGPVNKSWYYLTSLNYPDGAIATVHYRTVPSFSGCLGIRRQSVTSNTGWQIKFFYQSDTAPTDAASCGSWITLAKAVALNNAVEYCDPNADQCTFSHAWPTAQYSNDSTYSYATYPDGGVRRFFSSPTTYSIKTFDSSNSNRVYTFASISDPSFGFAVTKVTNATLDGVSTNYAFSVTGGTQTVISSTGADVRTYTAHVKNPSSTTNPNGVLTVKNALNNTTTYTYDAYNRVTTVTNPEGDWRQYNYDPDGANPTQGNILSIVYHPKPGSGLPTLSESWTYATCGNTKTCNKPLTYTDRNGNVTNYTWDPNSGNILTETLPADATGVHPEKRYFYTPLYAWVLNSSSQYTQEATPVYLLTEERTCITSVTNNGTPGSCAGGANDEVITDYYYGPNSGPNNLLLRGTSITAKGADGNMATRFTCYGYDSYGNKISETTPRAGLTSCP